MRELWWSARMPGAKSYEWKIEMRVWYFRAMIFCSYMSVLRWRGGDKRLDSDCYRHGKGLAFCHRMCQGACVTLNTTIEHFLNRTKSFAKQECKPSTRSNPSASNRMRAQNWKRTYGDETRRVEEIEINGFVWMINRLPSIRCPVYFILPSSPFVSMLTISFALSTEAEIAMAK